MVENGEAMENEGGSAGEEAATERNWEAEAKAEGWRPKDDFRGPEGKWIDAKEFVERGEKIGPIIKAKNRKLEQRVEEMQAATAQFAQHMNAQLARERQEKEALIGQIQAARAKAIDDGNGQAVINFERQEAQVREQINTLTPPPPIDPTVVAWRAENPWYGSDEDMSDFADAAGYRYRMQHPEASPQQILKHIEGRVKSRFPELSGGVQTRAPKPAGPEGGNVSAARLNGGSKKPSLADLPDDASRQVARRVINSLGNDKAGKPVMTEEDYMKSYLANQ